LNLLNLKNQVISFRGLEHMSTFYHDEIYECVWRPVAPASRSLASYETDFGKHRTNCGIHYSNKTSEKKSNGVTHYGLVFQI